MARDSAETQERPRSGDSIPALGRHQALTAGPSLGFPELLTPEQVAELLRVETGLLRRWRYERRGPASFKIGKYVRYRREDVLAWIEEQRVATGQRSQS